MSDIASLVPEPQSFEDLRWPVGIRLQCLLNHGPNGKLAMSALIGYVANEYLIVRTPLAAGFPMQIEIGESMRVRAFSGMYVSQFNVTVVRVYRNPYYLHVDYPSSIRVQKLRSAPRAKVDLAATASVDGKPEVEARLTDISVNGAQLTTTGLNAQKDQILLLRVDLGTADAEAGANLLEVKARIAAAKGLTEAGADQAADADGVQSLGLVFDSLDPSDGLRLANFVYQRLLGGV